MSDPPSLHSEHGKELQTRHPSVAALRGVSGEPREQGQEQKTSPPSTTTLTMPATERTGRRPLRNVIKGMTNVEYRNEPVETDNLIMVCIHMFPHVRFLTVP